MSDNNTIEKRIENITIHFNGETGIEIDTLIAALEYTRTTLKAAKKNLSGIKEYELIVEPFKQGSFIVDFTLLTYVFVEMFPTIKTMGEILIESIQIFKLLKGEQAKSITHNNITNNFYITGEDNTVLQVSNEGMMTVSDSNKISNELSQMAKKMIGDTTSKNSIEYILRSDENSEQVKLDTSELKVLTKPVYLKDGISKQNITINHVILQADIVNFKKPEGWKFSSSLSDKQFKATIEDNDFRRKVEQGEITFGTETRIEVVLQTIETELQDGSGKKEYKHSILKVENVISPEKFTHTNIDTDNT
jgi:hypothetical protein